MATELTYVGVQDYKIDAFTYVDPVDITKNQIWWLVESLTGLISGGNPVTGNPAAWTVVASCYYNGTSLVKDITGTNTWGNTFDSTKIVCADGTDKTLPRSWIVLHSPHATSNDLNLYMTIDMLYPNGADFYFSQSLPDVVAASSTARPVAEDEFGYSLLDANMYYAGNAINNGDVELSHYNHFVLCTSASQNRGGFYFFTNPANAEKFYATILATRIDNIRANDNQPSVAAAAFEDYDSFKISPSYSIFSSSNSGTEFYGAMRGRSTQATPGNDFVQVVAGSCAINGSYSGLIDDGYVNDQNESDGNYNEWHIPVFTLYSHQQFKGRLRDIKLASGVIPQLATRPAAPVGVPPKYDYIKVGDCWMPWPFQYNPAV
jgi:hypothetical protein